VDLVIDAVLGTGARHGFRAPRVAAGIPVLAVDLPSGLDGLTGAASDGVRPADRTVTFAALKPGLLLGDGPELAGEVSVADIGLDVSRSRAGLVADEDVSRLLAPRERGAHKWMSAVWVVAGSPGMLGSSHLCARAAQRAGAGYVRLSSPGVDDDPGAPTESVGISLPDDGWDVVVLDGLDRFAALALGPGLGRSERTLQAVRAVASRADLPIVLDGDGLAALGDDGHALLSGRSAPTVLTPHDGELRALLGGVAISADRTAAARDLARRCGSTVLLKGPTTVVSDPSGLVRYVTAGDARLATAGTGDVLTGIIAALLAQGLCPLDAAALGAHLHGRAGAIGSARGLVAGDLPDLLPLVFDQI
jgi:NAD(P)H-hydrate epimerase